MIIAIGIILLLILLYLLSLRGRTGQPGLAELLRWRYAHRGLHTPGVPENSMAAFRAALEAGFGIELDLHLLTDGGLAVIHDSKLERTTGKPGKVEELSSAQLSDYPLEGTEEVIPLFPQVLELFAGKAPLIIELKPDGDNYAALCEAAVAAMDGYSGPWCMESFDPRCIDWLRRHRPDIIRGQLSYNYLKGTSPLPWPLKFALTYNLLNFRTRPDFIAYDYPTRKTLSNFLCRRLWGIQGVTWTIRTPQEFAQATQEGWIPIFENFLPPAG